MRPDDSAQGAQQRVARVAAMLREDLSVREVLESIAEGCLFVMPDGLIVFSNINLQRMLGYSPDELIGQPLGILVPATGREAHDQHLAGFFDSPRRRPMGVGKTLAAVHRDGHHVPVEISLGHMSTLAGPLGLAFVSDVTQRARVEAELEQKNSDLEAFAHTVAHDLSGSLSGLVMASDLLPRVLDDPARRAGVLREMRRKSLGLVSVVRELLTFATMSRHDVEIVPVNMSEVLSRALDRLSAEVDRRGATIRRPRDLPGAMGHAPWLEEIWFNYLCNALKYGGQPPLIEVDGEVDADGRARFWVTDAGPGMPQAHAESLFCSDVSKPHADGHGLGLPIVARIADKMGAEVFVETAPGAGCCFGFLLPAGGAKDEGATG